MARENIFAYTAPTSNYPPYVSVNVDDDIVEVIVRSDSRPLDGRCGDTGSIKLTRKQAYALGVAPLENLGE